MNALKKRVSEALTEKKDFHPEALEGGARWSGTRLIVFCMAFAWIVRFLAEPVSLVFGVAASVVAGWGGEVRMTPLGAPMAYLGVALALALPITKLFDRLRPEDAKDALEASLEFLKGLSRTRAPGNVTGGVSGARTDGTDDRYEDDERGEG